MIQVVSGWIEARWNEKSRERWTRYFEGWQPDTDDADVRYRVSCAVFRLENESTLLPVWRLEKGLCQGGMKDRLVADIYLEQRKTEFKGKFVIHTLDFPWIDGLYPNKPVSKRDIVQLFPECKKMPRPYALDYIRDRA